MIYLHVIKILILVKVCYRRDLHNGHSGLSRRKNTRESDPSNTEWSKKTTFQWKRCSDIPRKLLSKSIKKHKTLEIDRNFNEIDNKPACHKNL